MINIIPSAQVKCKKIYGEKCIRFEVKNRPTIASARIEWTFYAYYGSNDHYTECYMMRNHDF